MLVITRREGERVKIGEAMVLVFRCRDGSVRLGIDAPPEVDVAREELLDRDTQPAPRGPNALAAIAGARY